MGVSEGVVFLHPRKRGFFGHSGSVGCRIGDFHPRRERGFAERGRGAWERGSPWGGMIVASQPQPLHGGRRHGDGPQHAFFLGRCRTAAGAGAAGVRAGQPADGPVVSALEAKRGRGRDEYPVRAMGGRWWRGWCSGTTRRRRCCASWAATRRCSGFAGSTRWAAGADAAARREDGGRCPDGGARGVRGGDGVPTAWAFPAVPVDVVDLEDRTGAVSGMVDALRGRLMAALRGLRGRPGAGLGTA